MDFEMENEGQNRSGWCVGLDLAGGQLLFLEIE